MKLVKLMNTDFINALNKLAKMELPVTTAFKVSEILEKCVAEQNMFQASRKALLEKHGQKDKKGTLKTNEDGTLYLMKDQAVFDKEYETLGQKDVELSTISLMELGSIKVSPEFLKSIKPILRTKS